MNPGTSATFTVLAGGTAPLRYQWQFGGVEIGGATNATFTVTNAQSSNQGGYRVVVSNIGASVTSTAATLALNLPPQLSDMLRLPNGSVQQGLMNASGVLDNFVDDYTYMTRVCDFGILTYTFHPHVIGRGHRMMMLERLIQRLIEGGAVFMTMESAMQEWLVRRGSPEAP